MLDVTKLAINGQTYTIKDSMARSGVETAQSAANSANNAVQRLDELSAEYSADTETINFNINV